MSIFTFKDYRTFLKARLAKLPKHGHGEISKIAQFIGVHSTLLSLIISGKRDLNLEQAYDLCRYLQLTELETEYFSLLVLFARAGNHRYKLHIQKKLESIIAESKKLSQRFEHEKSLTENERSVFYSSWLYSAVRLFTSVGEGKTVEEITQKFNQPRQKIINILNFLCSAGLAVQEKERYKMGTQRTFIEHGSPHTIKHHMNWRNKAMQKADNISEAEMMFTSPISLSRSDFEKIRSQLADLLQSISQTVKASPAEDIACLNIDFFWID